MTEFDHFAEAVNLVIKTKTPTLLLNLAETVERLERRVDKLEERNGKLERQNAGLKEQIKQEKESRKRGMSFDLQEDGSMGASLSKQVAELEHRMATIESTVFAKTTSHAGMDSDEKDDLEEEEVGNEAGELDDALAEDDEEAGAEVEGEARGSEQAEDDDESLLDDPLAEDDFDDYIHDSIEAARGTEAATPKRIEQQQADELAPNSLTSNALTEQGLLTSKAGPSLPLEPANGKGKQKVDGPNAATPGQPTEHPPPADPDRSSVRTVEQIREEHDYDKVDWVAYSRSVSHASNSPSDTVSGNNAIRYRALQVLYLGDDKATEAALKLLNRNNGPYYTRMRRISKSWTIANNGLVSLCCFVSRSLT